MKKLFALLFGVTALLSACNDDGDDPKYLTLDFENVPAASLAGPTSYGDNLYSEYAEGAANYDEAYPSYTGYHDAETDLKFGINEAYGSVDFWNGGIAISRWCGDQTANSYTNQCTVYSKTAVTNGGRGGSKTFAVVGLGGATSIEFKTTATECKAESIWIANTTYAALTIKNGGGTALKPLVEDKGWFLLTIEGYDASGSKTGEVKFYLADFREDKSPGLLEEWTKVDLTSLGKVHKLGFSLSGSDTGEYGLNTPQYFCFDDLRFKL